MVALAVVIAPVLMTPVLVTPVMVTPVVTTPVVMTPVVVTPVVVTSFEIPLVGSMAEGGFVLHGKEVESSLRNLVSENLAKCCAAIAEVLATKNADLAYNHMVQFA